MLISDARLWKKLKNLSVNLDNEKKHVEQKSVIICISPKIMLKSELVQD